MKVILLVRCDRVWQSHPSSPRLAMCGFSWSSVYGQTNKRLIDFWNKKKIDGNQRLIGFECNKSVFPQFNTHNCKLYTEICFRPTRSHDCLVINISRRINQHQIFFMEIDLFHGNSQSQSIT